MKRKLTNNIPLKIMSLAVGVLVWLIVVNVDNPIASKSFIVPDVELVNEAYVDSIGTGKVCMRDEEQTPVRVTVTAQRKTLNRITADSIRAVADLQQAVSLETNPVMVPIAASCPGILPSNITVSPQNLSVKLEDKVTSEFVVMVNNTGDGRPGKGYEIGQQTVNPEKVRITGPKSLMNKIDKVKVNVNVNGRTEDLTEQANVTIIDKNEETITPDFMKYLSVDNNGKTTVTTRLWKVRTGVKVGVTYKGQPAEGYVADSFITVPETISVAGTKEALDTLKEQGNTLWIEEGSEQSVDISGAKHDVEQKINIVQLLPEGLKLTSGSSEEIWVRVNILPEGGERFTVPTSEIKVKNKPEELQISFEIDKVEVRVKAKNGDMEEFNAKDIRASVDLKDKKEGNYEIPVKISLPDEYELIEDVTTEVKISKVSNTEENKK